MSQLLNKAAFAKYIPINTSGFKGIFSWQIFVDINVLKMRVMLSQIRNYSLFDKVSDGLNNNPENFNLVDILDKETVFQKEISQIEAIAIKQAFEVKLNEYTKSNNSQIGNNIVLHGVIPGLNNLHLRYEHTYILFTFMKFFIEEYEMIKMSLRSMSNINGGSAKKEKEEVERDEKEESANADNIAKTYTDCGGIFLEMISLVKVPTIRSFIARNIFNKKWDLNTAVSIKNDNSNILIKHYPLYDFNIWQYSSIHDKELVNILDALPENSDYEVADKLKRLTKQILYIIFNRESLIKQDHSKYVFTISTGLFLMYIYSLKMNSHYFIDSVYTASTNNGKTYINMLNYAFRYALEKFDVNTNVTSIKVEYAHGDVKDTDSLFDPMTAEIDTIFQQYRYLASIDQTEFLNTVFATVNSNVQTPVKADPTSLHKEVELAVSSNHLIKIEQFIDSKVFDPSQLTPEYLFKQSHNSMLDYVEVPLNDFFKTRRIISYLYCQLLYIQYNGVNKKFTDIDKYTNPILKRYCDIIIDDIFKAIDNNKVLAQNMTSTFQIYSQFIAPYIKNSAITDYTSLTMLYQVVIPYLHDSIGTSQFIDNFH